MTLARLLPGTPIDRLWSMDVDEGLAYLIAASDLDRMAVAAAAQTGCWGQDSARGGVAGSRADVGGLAGYRGPISQWPGLTKF